MTGARVRAGPATPAPPLAGGGTTRATTGTTGATTCDHGSEFRGRSVTDRSVTDADLAEVVDLLDDEHVRAILAATSEAPLSARELAERRGLSTSSIYRRVERLAAADLVDERTRPRRDGHHETVYVAAVERVELAFRDGEVRWTVDRRSGDVADELSRLWGRF